MERPITLPEWVRIVFAKKFTSTSLRSSPCSGARFNSSCSESESYSNSCDSLATSESRSSNCNGLANWYVLWAHVKRESASRIALCYFVSQFADTRPCQKFLAHCLIVIWYATTKVTKFKRQEKKTRKWGSLRSVYWPSFRMYFTWNGILRGKKNHLLQKSIR